jgi:hypothetical protein
MLKTSLDASFLMSRIKIDNSGCWLWVKRNGEIAPRYGQFVNNGKHYRSHVVAYEIFVGSIDKGQFVCHSCDNPPCCNPNHLFLGSPQDNSDDMVQKGRSNNGRQRISQEIIEKVRLLSGEGVSQEYIAKILKIGKGTVFDIIHFNKPYSIAPSSGG